MRLRLADEILLIEILQPLVPAWNIAARSGLRVMALWVRTLTALPYMKYNSMYGTVLNVAAARHPRKRSWTLDYIVHYVYNTIHLYIHMLLYA